MTILPAQSRSVSIAVPWRAVYDFIREPKNLPAWASGLASAVHEEDGEWVAESPMGRVKLRMAPANTLGVLDHDVTLPSGQVVYNALRALPNGTGCELVFTLFQTPGMSEADFARDADHVQRDLVALKQLLEGSGAARQPERSVNDQCLDYVELAVADIARAKAFYGAAFGWRFKDYGPQYCEFSDGRLTGGFTTQDLPRPGGPLVILYADDLVATQVRVEAAGGRISILPFDFPGGRRFHFLDPDGYEFAVWTAAR